MSLILRFAAGLYPTNELRRSVFAIPLAPEAVSQLKNRPKLGRENPYEFSGSGQSGVMHANGIRNLIHELGYEHISRSQFSSK